MTISIKENVSVVTIFDLQEVCHNRIACKKVEKVGRRRRIHDRTYRPTIWQNCAELWRIWPKRDHRTSSKYRSIQVSVQVSEVSSIRTDLKWSNSVTCPNRPSAIRRAYSDFLMEWIDTASVIVSTSPDEPPVMSMRKLQRLCFLWMDANTYMKTDSLPKPALAILFLPYLLELMDQLNGQLLLTKISTSFDNHRNTVPICYMQTYIGVCSNERRCILTKMTIRRSMSYSTLKEHSNRQLTSKPGHTPSSLSRTH